jgi:hypothetical protein
VIVVANDAEAEVACGLLRSSGIACGHRPAEVSQGPWEGLGTSGPREVLVAEGDVEEARGILDAGDTSSL